MNLGDNVADNIFALGWDVGGWMGSSNSFVLIEANKNENKMRWYFSKKNYQLKKDSLFELDEIINDLAQRTLSEINTLIIGIDAPLSFPLQFDNFLNQEGMYIKKPTKEIFNPLAYRATDRYIYNKYGKKPLSATFDRLGNNTTVAMSHFRYWKQKYSINLKFTHPISDKINIIETYPALCKPSKFAKAFKKLNNLIPVKIKEGTDRYDAALCALMAVQFGSENNFTKLPSLVFPPKEEIYRKEGWIYHFNLRNSNKK